MPSALIAADRGYLNKETVNFIVSRLACKFIGTHKRTHAYPFCFGDSKIARTHKGVVLPQKGARAVFSASREVEPTCKIYAGPNSRQTIEALVYREAVWGRLVAMLHNDQDL